ncbi:MAG TPA: hypothetical protein ENI86_18415 [Acidimicrobiales bacterium]|nr:hypothetical protein [Acidimicrobiales bacterium]
MAWEVSGTDEFAQWFGSLSEAEQDPIIAVVELLAEHGPELDRPYADRIKGSKYHNMKELRPRGVGKHFRVLFIFDPRREAILLLGGDKSGQWSSWYATAIPQAERLYEEYLHELNCEDLLEDDE